MTTTTVITLDYEIHGTGEGCPSKLMVEPTWRLLDQLEAVGARLTLFAEMAEILRFQQVRDETGVDRFHFADIAAQLRHAQANGHDVQLHIHPSFLGARLTKRGFAQDWAEYDIAGLSAARAREVVTLCRSALEEMLRPVQRDYAVYAFRAANWSMMPTRNIAVALVENGIRVDASVFKGGRRRDLVHFDYSRAPSEALPWRASLDDICVPNDGSPLWEYPIYCEIRPLSAFVSLNRFYRVAQGWVHPFGRAEGADGIGAGGRRGGRLARLGRMLGAPFRRYPWKADFNQASGRQLIAALKRAHARLGGEGRDLPFVLIGHPKLFNAYNQRDFAVFLDFVRAQPDRFRFGTFADVLPSVRE